MVHKHSSSALNEFDKEEWRLVARKVRPDISDEEYDELWDDFCKFKADHEARLKLH